MFLKTFKDILSIDLDNDDRLQVVKSILKYDSTGSVCGKILEDFKETINFNEFDKVLFIDKLKDKIKEAIEEKWQGDFDELYNNYIIMNDKVPDFYYVFWPSSDKIIEQLYKSIFPHDEKKNLAHSIWLSEKIKKEILPECFHECFHINDIDYYIQDFNKDYFDKDKLKELKDLLLECKKKENKWLMLHKILDLKLKLFNVNTCEHFDGYLLEKVDFELYLGMRIKNIIGIENFIDCFVTIELDDKIWSFYNEIPNDILCEIIKECENITYVCLPTDIKHMETLKLLYCNRIE